MKYWAGPWAWTTITKSFRFSGASLQLDLFFFLSSKLKRKTKRKKKIRTVFGLRFYSTRLIWSAFIHYLGNYARRMNLSSLWHGAILLNWTSTEENIHVSESAPQLPCFISRASRGVGSSASAKTSHPHKILPLYHIILVLLTRSGTESNFFPPSSYFLKLRHCDDCVRCSHKIKKKKTFQAQEAKKKKFCSSIY